MQSPRTTFDAITELVRVTAQLLWPVTIILVLVMFREDLHRLASRLRRGKFLGQELELTEETQKVERQVEAAERAEPPKPVLDPAKGRSEQLSELQAADDRVRRFLEEAAKDKLLALVRMWIEIEQEVRTITATRGLLQFVRVPNITEYVGTLAGRNVISKETADSILGFHAVRDRLVHGNLREAYRDSELVALIDSGLRLLEILRSIPRETYKVSGLVPFFSDASATKPVDGARALILEISSQDGKHGYAAYPTTKAYERGQVLSWEWNLQKVWGPSWYRDPQTGAIKHGWDSAGEFVGRPLETIG